MATHRMPYNHFSFFINTSIHSSTLGELSFLVHCPSPATDSSTPWREGALWIIIYLCTYYTRPRALRSQIELHNGSLINNSSDFLRFLVLLLLHMNRHAIHPIVVLLQLKRISCCLWPAVTFVTLQTVTVPYLITAISINLLPLLRRSPFNFHNHLQFNYFYSSSTQF